MFLLALLGLASSWADGRMLDDALRAVEDGRYEQAVENLQPYATRGNRLAQFALGYLYEQGYGVEKDLVEAASWYHRAAMQGLAQAQFNIGNAYKHGRGVDRSDDLAVYWWKQAAEQAMPAAQFNLGTAYLFGRGVGKDARLGRQWREKAIANGFEPRKQGLVSGTAGATDSLQVSSSIQGSHWILTRNADHYTIQLASTADENSAVEFLGELNMTHTVAVCPYVHAGRTRYALVLGTFETRSAATAALRHLPDSLRRAGAWIRKFSTLQQATRALPARDTDSAT